MTPIHLRNVPPPMETFKHIEFLTFMAKWIKPECYLELGVRCGDSLDPISQYCKMCCAVDITFQHYRFAKRENIMFVQKSTDEFFATLDPDTVFDMVFIDAAHEHAASLKDFQNVAPHVIEDGFIFLHDTYPCSQEMMQPCYSNDSYKTALFIKNMYRDDFEVVTLPFNPGLTIVKKMKHDKQILTV